MPQVPYIDRPGGGDKLGAVEPTREQTMPVHIQVNEDMFGANVGRAIKDYGTTLEQAGGEIFGRGQAMLDMKNQADADQHMVNFAKGAAQLHADFVSKQGANASPEALQKLNEDIENLRQQNSQGLSMMGLQHYNADTRRLVISQMGSAATHAGEQLRIYKDETVNGRMDLHNQIVAANPNDDLAVQRGLQQNQQMVQEKAGLWGWSPEKVKDELYKANAKTLATQIEGLSEIAPGRADRILKENRKWLGELEVPLQKKVDDAINRIASRNIAGDVIGGKTFELGDKRIDTEKTLAILREKETGGVLARGQDPYLHVDVETKHGHALGAYGEMSGFLQEDLKRYGMPAMSEEEYLKSREAQDTLNQRRVDQIYKDGGTFNDVMSIQISGKKFKDVKPGDVTDHYGSNGWSYTKDANRILAGRSTLGEVTNLAREKAEREFPDHPNAGDFAVFHTKALWEEQQAEEKSSVRAAVNTLEGAMLKPMADGHLPQNADELTISPEAKTAWNNVDNTVKLRVLAQMSEIARREGKWALTPAGAIEIDKVRGMLRSDDPDQVQKGLDYSITSMHIPAGRMLELMDEKRKVMQSEKVNPQVDRAMNLISSQLNAVGISRKLDPDTYDTIRGTMIGILEQRLAEHQDIKTPEILEIGKNLIKDHTEKTWSIKQLWGGPAGETHDVLARTTVPDKALQAINDDYQKTYGRNAEPIEARIEYLRQLYTQMYGKPKAGPALVVTPSGE